MSLVHGLNLCPQFEALCADADSTHSSRALKLSTPPRVGGTNFFCSCAVQPMRSAQPSSIHKWQCSAVWFQGS